MRTNVLPRVAGALVALEAAGLVALVIWQISAILVGDTGAVETAIALVVLTAIGAAAVAAFAVAIWRDRSWGRSGAIVTQLLILAVALGAATGAYAAPGVALTVAAPALVTLVVLILAVREAARSARLDGDRG
jgi:multisubunit Na+/H+ antiporter MnhF subunit